MSPLRLVSATAFVLACLACGGGELPVEDPTPAEPVEEEEPEEDDGVAEVDTAGYLDTGLLDTGLPEEDEKDGKAGRGKGGKNGKNRGGKGGKNGKRKESPGGGGDKKGKKKELCLGGKGLDLKVEVNGKDARGSLVYKADGHVVKAPKLTGTRGDGAKVQLSGQGTVDGKNKKISVRAGKTKKGVMVAIDGRKVPNVKRADCD